MIINVVGLSLPNPILPSRRVITGRQRVDFFLAHIQGGCLLSKTILLKPPKTPLNWLKMAKPTIFGHLGGHWLFWPFFGFDTQISSYDMVKLAIISNFCFCDQNLGPPSPLPQPPYSLLWAFSWATGVQIENGWYHCVQHLEPQRFEDFYLKTPLGVSMGWPNQNNSDKKSC